MSDGLAFPADWPQPCPPEDAVPANQVVYRAVGSDPPTAEDFLSYREEGKSVRNPQMACLACGISVLPRREDAEHHLKLFPARGPYIAEGVLTPDHGKTKRTPSLQQPAHITWWCYEGVNRSEAFHVV
jgi:hypothetical protein